MEYTVMTEEELIYIRDEVEAELYNRNVKKLLFKDLKNALSNLEKGEYEIILTGGNNKRHFSTVYVKK